MSMKALRIALAALLAATLLLIPATPAAAVTNCQGWDGVGGTTDVVHTATSSGAVDGNLLLGVRFKAIGTNPVFHAWEFNSAGYGTVSFYLHNWGGSLLAYRDGVSTTTGAWNYLAASDVNLTTNNEYIVSVYIPIWNTIYTNAPILYPSATNRMSATSGSTYYYTSSWPNWPTINAGTWNNADPGAGNNWLLSPQVCQP